ncbi:hypothetical protein RN001_005086 [Aquatica leii]|uniref:Uncharacterized protein n=1 Tax=Aquatica leii TaxID=1421715 RepID=A0AAN7Q0Q8_9COLE|nr:hypothetical protein RN001_005086 [Aquatica leii]
MNTENEFYLTLLSNSSMNYYPNNTTANFMTQLPKRVRLTGEWVVGISEIQYPCSFLAVGETDNLMYYRTEPPEEHELSLEEVLNLATKHFLDNKDSIHFSYQEWHIVKISPGNYESIEDVITEINNHEIIKKLINFKYNRITKRVFLKVNTTLSVLGFSRRLALQLGFQPDQNLAKEKTSAHPANIWTGIPSQMFIYCDIVEPQLVGDVLAPLLRIVNVTSDNYNYGCHKDVVFSPVHYIPLMRKEFENIEINIRTDTAASMPFEFGTLNLKLHFKKLN